MLSLVDGDHMQAAAEAILKQIRILADQPTAARSFLAVDVYGRGVHTPSGEAFRETLFMGLKGFAHGLGISAPLNVAFVDFGRIWDGVLGPYPGYRAFGYSSTGWCAPCNEHGCTMDGMCGDPEHYFEWLPGYVAPRPPVHEFMVLTLRCGLRHPSKETMRIMADYVQRVLDECQAQK